jgi:hypothetical protein
MPFVSKKQARYLYAKEPKVAKEFAAKTGNISDLPEKKGTNRQYGHMLKARPVKPAKKNKKRSAWAGLKYEDKSGGY